MLNRSATQCIAFSLSRKQSEFFFLIFAETIAVPKENTVSNKILIKFGLHLFNQIKDINAKIWLLLPDFIIVRRQLVKELFYSIFLPHRVHIGDLVIGEGRKVEVHLGIIRY